MKNKGPLWIGVMLSVCCLLLFGIGFWVNLENNNAKDVVAESNSQSLVESEIIDEVETEIGTEDCSQEETEVVEVAQKIRLMMLGDNLMHYSIVHSGFQADGTRNYDMLFEPIKDYLLYADIKITNQETIMAGNNLEFTSFPRFNSPTELGDSIANAGFNVVLHATNHAADKGIAGINHCIDFWEKYPEVLVTGIFKEADVENQDIGLITMDGVTFAILNYTYSPNTGTLPTWLRGHLGMLCNWNEDTGVIDLRTIHPDVLTDIATAEQMADVVIVCPHWGNEYTFVPSIYQKEFAKQMTEAGADLIIGTHPHVIQPIEWIETENGNRALCYYSLGNYVSSQERPKTMLEAMAWVSFEVKDGSVNIIEEETGAIPLVYQYGLYYQFQNVYFLDEYTEELAAAHGIHMYGEPGFSLENLQKWTDEVLGTWRLQYQEVFRDCIKYEMWR